MTTSLRLVLSKFEPLKLACCKSLVLRSQFYRRERGERETELLSGSGNSISPSPTSKGYICTY